MFGSVERRLPKYVARCVGTDKWSILELDKKTNDYVKVSVVVAIGKAEAIVTYRKKEKK